MSFQNKNIEITSTHLTYLLLIVVSIGIGIAYLLLPLKYAMVLLITIPAFIVLLLIMKNPFLGIIFFYIYEYLRPYDFIPALRPLRLAMIIEIVTLISWVFALILRKRKLVWINYNLFYLLFLIVVSLGVIFALNNQYAYNMTQLMAVNFIMFIIAVNVVDSFEKQKKLIWFLMLVHFYLALKGIMNYLTGNTWGTSGVVASGFLSDENDFALAINVMIPFAYFMFLQYKSMIYKLLTLGMLVTYILAVVSSFSRGGWIGLIVAIAFCISFSRRKIVGLVVVILLLLPILLFAPSKYWEEIQTISDTSEDTADTRIRYWKSAYYMYLDHPVFGVGAGNGGVWLPNYAIGYKFSATQWGRAFHGTFPQIIAELGTAGLTLYLLLIFYMIRYMNRVRKKGKQESSYTDGDLIASAVLASMASYMASAIFLSTAYYSQFWTILTMGMICYLCTFYKPDDSKQRIVVMKMIERS